MKIFKIIPFLAITIALNGCVGSFLEPKEDPTVFYIMQSYKDISKVDVKAPIDVNLLSIMIPTYMARNQIVSLNKSGDVEISEFYRWAESPTSGFERVLRQNITSANDKISIYIYPDISSQKDAVILKILVSECIGEIGGKLNLKGYWVLSEKQGTRNLKKDFSFSLDSGNAYSDYTNNIDKALYLLSQELTKSIAEFVK